MKTISKTRNALFGLTSAMLLLAAGMPTAHAAINYSEPPDLPPFLFPLGSVSAGLNTVSGSIAASSNLGVLDPGSDTRDGFQFTVPAGHIVTGIELIISGYTQTGPVGPVVIAPSPGMSFTLINRNASFPNIVTAPGGLAAGSHRIRLDALLRGDGTSSLSLNWKFNFTVTAANTAPTVSSPGSTTIACTSPDGATSTVSFPVTDANNDALTVQWTVDNVPLLPVVTLPAGSTLSTNAILLDYEFGFGEHDVSVSVTDGNSAPVTASTKVTVAAHDAPEPQIATLPTITDECSVSITSAPLANDPCAEGGVVSGVSSLGPLPLNFTAQGTYTVTWTYTSPHDGMLSTTQEQTVIVKDITPPTITCPPDVSVAFGSVPAAATDPAGFLAQGGTITDNCDPIGTVTSTDFTAGYCPTLVARSYTLTDAAGNASSCLQIITVNNLFAEDGILWLQPLARNGASSDTDPGAGGTLKYRFKLGSTIPIKVQAQSCDGNVSANANVTGTVVVFGDTDMDGVVDATETPIYYNGVGEANGVMDKVDGKLQFNLDTKKLIQTFKCYILQVTVTDSSTGESRVETLALQSK